MLEEIIKGKPLVGRIGIRNGALKKLLAIISTDENDAFDFLENFIDKLERAGFIRKIGQCNHDKRIPILETLRDLSMVRVGAIVKTKEDIMTEPKIEVSIEQLQARVQELRRETQGGVEEIKALSREINAKLESGEELDQNVVNRYNLLRKQPPRSPEELVVLHQKLFAFELVIKDLTGQTTVEVQPTEKSSEAVKQNNDHSEEEKLAYAWFSCVKDSTEWVLSGRIAEIVVKTETFKTISHVRSILSASANKVQRNSKAGNFKGLFESRELNKSDRGKYDPHVRLLYRLSKAGEQFISDYTAKK